MKNLLAIGRGIIKAGTLGLATPLIEAGKNRNTPVGDQKPHNPYSIGAQRVTQLIILAVLVYLVAKGIIPAGELVEYLKGLG